LSRLADCRPVSRVYRFATSRGRIVTLPFRTASPGSSVRGPGGVAYATGLSVTVPKGPGLRARRVKFVV
jgi:hypothetical protein